MHVGSRPFTILTVLPEAQAFMKLSPICYKIYLLTKFFQDYSMYFLIVMEISTIEMPSQDNLLLDLLFTDDCTLATPTLGDRFYTTFCLSSSLLRRKTEVMCDQYRPPIL